MRRARRAWKFTAISVIVLWIAAWVYIGLHFLIVQRDRGFALSSLLIMLMGLRDIVIPRVVKYLTRGEPPNGSPPRHAA